MRLILVGGFLGSGKTTAVVHAARLLMTNNQKVAVITNDQGDRLVDSAYAKSFGIVSREVSGGCFCCHYRQLDEYLQSLETNTQPDVVFAESVGSCTDLIATLVKPLNRFRPHLDVVISIFADAVLLTTILEGSSSFENESVRYIYKKQLEEADVLILNKVDLLSSEQIKHLHEIVASEYPGKIILHQNSLKEKDVLTWWSCLEQFARPQQRMSLSIDYSLYGEGESKLAWLDKNVEIHSPQDNAVFISRWIIRSIADEIQSMHFPIGHLKFFVETPSHNKKVSITATSTSADIHLTIPEATDAKLLINARVETSPEQLQLLVNDVLVKCERVFHCSIVSGNWSAFKPGFPRPTHRIAT